MTSPTLNVSSFGITVSLNVPMTVATWAPTVAVAVYARDWAVIADFIELTRNVAAFVIG